jgi:hypothetical protein
MSLRPVVILSASVSLLSVSAAALAATPAAPAPASQPATQPAAPAVPPEDQPLTPEEEQRIEGDDPRKADALTIPPPEVDRDEPPPPKPRATKSTYPENLGERPITITRNTGEASLDVELVGGGSIKFGDEKLGPRVREVLKARFGVTQDLEVFVGWGVGSQRLSAPEGADGTVVGKQFEVGVGYTILADHLGVTLSAPMYSSPFTWNVSIGLPFRFNLGSRLAIVGGNDMIQIATGEDSWPVDVAEPERTEVFALGSEEENLELPGGVFNLNLGAIVKLREGLAVTGHVRLTYVDFDSDLAQQSMWFGVAWTKRRYDLMARVGFAELDVGASAGLGLFAAFRL